MNSNIKIKMHKRIKHIIINLDLKRKSLNQNYQKEYYIEVLTI